MLLANLGKKIILTCTLGALLLNYTTLVNAAPHSRHHTPGIERQRPRPSHIPAPHVQVNRPGEIVREEAHVSRPRGPMLKRHDVPAPNVQRPAGPAHLAKRPEGVATHPHGNVQRPIAPGHRPQGSLQRPTAPQHRPHGNVHRPTRPGTIYHGPGPQLRPHFAPRPRPRHYPYPHWRRSNIVFHYGWPRASYWWGCRRGISFGEYLLLALMVESLRQQQRISMEALYTEHVNGLSYEELCTKYDLDWHLLQTRQKLRYNQMHSYATGMGITFWTLSDRIYY